LYFPLLTPTPKEEKKGMLYLLINLTFYTADMMGLKRVCGYIVLGTLELDGPMNVHIQIGHHFLNN